jgi:hypothetical protein
VYHFVAEAEAEAEGFNLLFEKRGTKERIPIVHNNNCYGME